jgi:hypothetical protein
MGYVPCRVLVLAADENHTSAYRTVCGSCVIIGALAMFGLRYYRTKVQYRPVADEGIEVL